MQKYSKYQETDLLWMGEVPSHWRKDKISRMVEFSASGGTPTSTNESYYDGNIKWVQTGELNDCEIFDTEKKLTEEGFKASSTKLFPAETLLVAMYGATIGKLGILKTEATTNQACCALFFNTKKWNTKYFFYYFLNIREKLIFSSYGGGQPNISQEVIKQERLFVPPFTEQTAIAAYLDQATANIDKVIATKQKQLEKLEQYKQSKIHECVTKGLNPDVTLKPSGIDWIGNVPSHWKVERLKYVVSKIGSGVTPKGGAAVYLTTGIPLIRSQNVHFDGLDFSDIACITEEIHDDMSGSKVKRGDVLLNITGASIGRCYYYDIDDEANVNQHVCILRPNDLITTNFLYYLMMSEVGQSQIFSGFKGSGREGLGNEAIKVFKIPLPKTKEQREISDYLDFFCDNIKNEKSIIEQQIEKLKQYRKCLIHECVTGKRKVVND